MFVIVEGERAHVIARCVAMLETIGAQDIAVCVAEGVVTARLGEKSGQDAGKVTLRFAAADGAQRVEVEGSGAAWVVDKLDKYNQAHR